LPTLVSPVEILIAEGNVTVASKSVRLLSITGVVDHV
jgi:hypothetical protein